MKTFSILGVFGAMALGAALVGCGSDGAQGPAGSAGTSGQQGPAGPAGPSGPSGVGVGDPQVSAISPARAFLGRKLEVTVSGVATKWAAATTIDFGTGITVDKVTAPSPDALLVALT